MFKNITLRRVIQSVSLILFLALLIAVSVSASGFAAGKLFSIFLMSDPLSALAASVAARDVVVFVAVPTAIVLLTALFGRVFCGYFCPMGTTIDIIDSISGTKINKAYPKLNSIRYILLFAVITAAVLGVNLAFHFLPISLATRLYGLVVYPAGNIAVSEAIGTGQSLFGLFGYFNVPDKRYASIFFIVALFAILCIMSRFSKRFWCRYICPTGALLGLLSVFAPYKRRVENSCTTCGRCEKNCPTYAVKDIYSYSPQDCISCKKCTEVCAVKADKFSLCAENIKIGGIALTRRETLGGLAVGGTVTLFSMSELKSLLNKTTEHGDLVYAGLIRPPAALPEKEFLAKCIRCGQCMVACPTNGLQPLLTQSGTAAAFSPVLVPLRGKCDANCNKCGVVCPTGAIAELPLVEKQHAKIGTARIIRDRCLAWEENKECIVCGEVCPYNSMKLVPETGYDVTVPRVDESRCFGCGACEHSCPLEIPAVVIEPVKALRLTATNYTERSKELGLELTVSGEQKIFEQNDADPDGLPPGFTE